jgi:hypothetical protein
MLRAQERMHPVYYNKYSINVHTAASLLHHQVILNNTLYIIDTSHWNNYEKVIQSNEVICEKTTLFI